MSHIADIDLCFDDLDALEEVCKRRGWTLVRGQTTYTWVGRWYDDSPVPRSLFESEDEYQRVKAMKKADRVKYMEQLLGRCAHVIKIPGHWCEVGVVDVGGHYRLAWDWASSLSTVMGSMDAWGRDSLGPLTPFLHEYVELAALHAVEAERGYLIERSTLADGSLYLEYEIP